MLYSAGLTSAWWPYAGMYFCNAWNILRINPRTGKTAFQSRFPQKTPPMLMPFGSGCSYVPPRVSYVGLSEPEKSKVEPRGKEAILIGYYTPPGEASNKEYIVAPLSNFVNKNSNVKIVNTRDVRFTQLTYPIREYRSKQQLMEFNKHNPPITHAQYLEMIFGDQGGDSVIQDRFANIPIADEDNTHVTEAERLHASNEQLDDATEDVMFISQHGGSSSSSSVIGNNIPHKQVTTTSSQDHVKTPVSKDNADAIRLTKSLEFFASRRKSKTNASTTAMAAIVEFACSPNSQIGVSAESKGLEFHRLCKEVCDLTSKQGLDFAMNIVRNASHPIHLHGSLPCTPWSRWNVSNQHKYGDKFVERINQQKLLSISMLKNFVTVADYVIKNKGTISFEWPRYCVGWDVIEVKHMIDRFKLKPANVDGCAVGVINKAGTHSIKKPWCFVCSDVSLANKLDVFKCDKTHKHVPCAGNETLQTGFYPTKLADTIVEHVINSSNNKGAVEFCGSCYERSHACVCNCQRKNPITTSNLPLLFNDNNSHNQSSMKQEVILQQLDNQICKAVNKARAKLNAGNVSTKACPVTTTAAPCYINDVMTEDVLIDEHIKQAHREKINTAPLNFMGAVVKALKRKDPLWHSEEAKAALMKESGKLIKAGVWDVIPVEKDEVIRKYPDATFSRLFEILGLKNSELSNPVYKARIVVQGSNVTDASGEYVYFADTTSSPTNMCAIRT